MFALIVLQGNTCDHVCNDIRQLYDLYARFSAAVDCPRGRRGILLTVRDDIAGRLVVPDAATTSRVSPPPPQGGCCRAALAAILSAPRTA